MKSTQIISMGILGMLVLSPIFALAEGGAVSGTASGEVKTETTTSPSGPSGATNWSFGASNPTTVSSGGSGSGRVVPLTSSTTHPDERRMHQPLMIKKEMHGATSTHEEGVRGPRDVATGQSSGRRMMASGTKPLSPKMEERMEKRDQKMASGTERMDEHRGKKEERRGEVMKRMATHMVTKMQAAIDRFTKIADRLDSRVAKLKAKGVNTANAEILIALARAKTTEAMVSLSIAKTQIGSMVVSASTTDSTSNGVGGAVRDSMQKTRDAIEAAHKALVEATKSLRANDKSEVGANSSTTVSQ